MYNTVSVWVERQRQKILKELGAGATEEKVLEELAKVKSELVVDYLVTGSKVPLVNLSCTQTNGQVQVVGES
jgi:predicted RND superfamily exporter protein